LPVNWLGIHFKRSQSNALININRFQSFLLLILKANSNCMFHVKKRRKRRERERERMRARAKVKADNRCLPNFFLTT